MNIKDTKIILASASPRRLALLGQVGIDCEVIPSGCDEIIRESIPERIVKQLASDKAHDVAERLGSDYDGAIVIGADTVVAVDERILGKPHSYEEAFDMIKLIQGREHSVITGVNIICKGREVCFAETTGVSVYPMSDEEIEEYLACGESMDKAGAYGIQGFFAAYILGINGDYNNVVGLPVSRLIHEIKKM
ncbi:MAG: Maf family protein [Lachnospiraceae bacterium]|nr:Maf family protein [Lachnospiraceae bacterium]